MNLNDILTTLLTSTVVSTIVSFVFKSIFESRLKHHFEKELENLRQQHALEIEKIKSKLTIEADTVHQLSERRLGTYPKLVELIYRTRNLAREIAYNKQSLPILSDELASRVYELEERLFASRMDLERDEVFDYVHDYKNTIMGFHRLDRDLQHFYEKNEVDETDKIVADMKILFSRAETDHKLAIEKLSTIKA
jgi:hypothetical protein